MNMFLCFGEQPISDMETSAWNVYLGTMVDLNNSEEHKFRYFRSPKEAVSTHARETMPLIREFEIIAQATSEVMRQYYLRSGNITGQTAALLRGSFEAYLMFAKPTGNTSHHFRNFPPYSYDLESLTDPNQIPPAQKVKNWAGIFYDQLLEKIHTIDPRGRVLSTEDKYLLNLYDPETVGTQFTKAIAFAAKMSASQSQI